jgi:uncharacterized protein
MGSEVYFSQRRATQGGGLLQKLEQLCDAAGFAEITAGGGQVALLTSFSEPGNTTYTRPTFLQRLAQRVVADGASPFLTDTLPLPPSQRRTGADVLRVASAHGFNSLGPQVALRVADGLSGADELSLPVPGDGSPRAVFVAAGIAEADGLLVVSHVTCHEWGGFAGALMQLGFGAASLRGKGLIVGLSDLTEASLRGADADHARAHRMVQSAAAIAAQKAGRVGYVNLLLDVTPEDDNRGWSDAPIVPDIGILVSRDPVAIDQATADLLQQAPGIAGTRLPDPLTRDKLRAVNPAVEWEASLRLAEELELGCRDYELMIV